MAGTAALALLSLVAYVFDRQGAVAFAGVLAGALSVSGVLWVTRLTRGVFRTVLVVDTVVLTVWVWLMGGHAIGLAAVYAWVLLAAALALGPGSVFNYLALCLLAICVLGLGHLFFATVDYDHDRILLLNFAFSAALLGPIAVLTKKVGEGQREAELVERQSSLRLAELREMREEFLSRVSFEMRTPLTSVKGFTSTMLDSWDTLPNSDKVRFLHIVNRQSDKLARLIQSLVDFAQLDSGTIQLVSEKINVADVLGRVRVRALRADATGIEIYVDCPAGLWVQGDGERVKDMLSDLIDNALSYGAPPVEITARPVDDMVEVAIRDSGAGVPAERQPLLFVRRTGAVEQTRKEQGIGLSLPLARELSRAMGGDVRFEPAAAGACFVVSLPAAEPPASRVEGADVPMRLLAEFPHS